MKNVFDMILMIWISLTFLFCMVIFGEEVYIRQQTIHIRNKINEIVEINGGYTATAENEVNNLLSNIKYTSNVVVSKRGKLNYGEKLQYKVTLYYSRNLPILNQNQNIEYSIDGEYYNAR